MVMPGNIGHTANRYANTDTTDCNANHDADHYTNAYANSNASGL